MASDMPRLDLLTAFNFSVEITVTDEEPVCGVAFAECDGLELSQEVKTIREGGNNGVHVRLAGPVTYGTLTLKRGMTTSTFDLWDWFEKVSTDPSLRAKAEVVVYARPGCVGERVRFALTGCRPLKLKAPPLNAKDGMIAVEELQVAYESLTLKRPEPPSPSGGSGA
jgi:phage tail-like protein